MIVHVVPVGLSIVTALRQAKPNTAPAHVDARTVAAPLSALSTGFARDPAAEASRLLLDPAGIQELGRFRDAIRLPAWDAAISAEVASLREARHRPEQDCALLLATDTVDGLLAAVLNATRLAPRSATYLDRPEQVGRHPASLAGSVQVVRFPGMDLAHQKDFNDSMRQLGRFGRSLHDGLRTLLGEDAVEPELRFHISGGYKAGIPFVLALAEGMRSLRQGSTSVSACCLHETTSGPEPLIPIPLRFFSDLTRVRAELAAVEEHKQPANPGEALLEGYAYEATADGYQLTEFGAGLHELLTPSQAPPQDVLPR